MNFLLDPSLRAVTDVNKCPKPKVKTFVSTYTLSLRIVIDLMDVKNAKTCASTLTLAFAQSLASTNVLNIMSRYVFDPNRSLRAVIDVNACPKQSNILMVFDTDQFLRTVIDVNNAGVVNFSRRKKCATSVLDGVRTGGGG